MCALVDPVCLQGGPLQHRRSRSVLRRRWRLSLYCGARPRLELAMPCIAARHLLAGAILGGISGLLKSYCNVNEVISGIMLNWIALYLTNMLLDHGEGGRQPLHHGARHTTNPSAVLPSSGAGRSCSTTTSTSVSRIPLSVLIGDPRVGRAGKDPASATS